MSLDMPARGWLLAGNALAKVALTFADRARKCWERARNEVETAEYFAREFAKRESITLDDEGLDEDEDAMPYEGWT